VRRGSFSPYVFGRVQNGNQITWKYGKIQVTANEWNVSKYYHNIICKRSGANNSDKVFFNSDSVTFLFPGRSLDIRTLKPQLGMKIGLSLK